jgi:hypothetical protein
LPVNGGQPGGERAWKEAKTEANSWKSGKKKTRHPSEEPPGDGLSFFRHIIVNG